MTTNRQGCFDFSHIKPREEQKQGIESHEHQPIQPSHYEMAPMAPVIHTETKPEDVAVTDTAAESDVTTSDTVAEEQVVSE